MERERLLSHTTGTDRVLAARILDQAELSLKRAAPVETDFLDPHEQEVAKDLLHFVPEVKFLVFGGYRKAERQRLVLAPSFYLTESIEPPLTFFSIKALAGKSEEAAFGHRDVLGSLLGLGLKREKIGDILITTDEAQIIVAAEIGEFVLAHLERVGAVRVKVDPIDPEQLNTPPERIKEIKTTVASLRLDAVAGLGFGMSRTKMAREIKAEKVKVNWRSTTDPDYQVKVGDVLSIKGRGRVVVAETTGLSKKGRIGIILKKLI
ncbi:MAG TPA: photosystem II S4 domain protein [Firmicutes bacterium]|nr:photosystem II S4 domain protein [Bacillota bacterium]